MPFKFLGSTFTGISEALMNPTGGGEDGKPNRPHTPKNNYAGVFIALFIFAVMALFSIFGGR